MENEVIKKAVSLFDKQYPKLKNKKEYIFEYADFPTIVIEHDPKKFDEYIFYAVNLKSGKIQPFTMNPIVVENLEKRGDNLGLIKLR